MKVPNKIYPFELWALTLTTGPVLFLSIWVLSMLSGPGMRYSFFFLLFIVSRSMVYSLPLLAFLVLFTYYGSRRMMRERRMKGYISLTGSFLLGMTYLMLVCRRNAEFYYPEVILFICYLVAFVYFTFRLKIYQDDMEIL